MLRITVVTTDGAEPQTYELDHTRLSNREAKMVERYTGMRAIIFQAGLAGVRDFDEKGNMVGAPVVSASEYSDADHTEVLVWLAMRRNGQPDLKLEDVPEFDILKTVIDVVADPTDAPPPGEAADPQIPAAPDAQLEPNPDGAATG